MRSFARILLVIVIIASNLFLGGNTVDSQQVISRSSFSLEENSIPTDDSFSPAKSIYISPVSIESARFISDEKWYEGIYYYQAFRLNQGDFLYHYVVTRNGLIYQGNLKGEDHRFLFEDESEKPIVIAYLTPEGESDFSVEALERIKDLASTIANRNSVDPSLIEARDVQFVAKQGEAIKLRSRKLTGRWERSVTAISDFVKDNYNPVPKQISFAVDSVSLPSEAVNYGDNVLMNITIRNTGQDIYYQGQEADPIISKVSSEPSKFFLNQIWLSQTQAAIGLDNAIIRPGETGTYQVRIGVPLFFGEIVETFELADSLGRTYPDSRFDLKLQVNRPDREVVEITQTETGQLNVRENPNGSAPISGRVTPGQRFFVIERTTNGWIKLDLGDNKTGWVVASYTRVV
ncbi:MAG: SH3 domain-containing protein [Candidatus Dojkabacteria bacterium]|uniref:SH3 domain-containing protein n=1 Tax=Candidatus Dojkabacteria bacterium TaxID=2099670 RepID=A0A952AHL7_9BACT|nr:SH3 domain-containing protein [Candidatus Dojkabacteria bacterium]WKZ27611.1 MAG: SH3 domain-containing protein [Candidatus Dojkabacteria bacterium]